MNVEEKKNVRTCILCEKELKEGIIVQINDKSICYECSAKIACALDDMEDYLEQLYGGQEENNNTKTNVAAATKKKSARKNKKSYDLAKIVEQVCKSVKGQDELVKRIAYTLIKNQKFPDRKSNILIVGNSGMGKTQTLKSVLELLDIPYVIEDITSYTEAGYIGKDTDELVKNLYYKYGCNAKAIEKGVIVIDEFDKLAKNDGYGKDVSGIGVQKSLLKLLEGKIMDIQLDIWGSTAQIDTSKMTFVLLGVFPEIKEMRQKRLKNISTKAIGFVDNTSNIVPVYQNANYIAEDFEKVGFMTEVIGRVKVFLEANELTEKNFYDILTSSKLSSLADIRKEFNARKIRLLLKKGTLDEIAKKAYSYKTGARAINTVLEDTFSKVLYELDSNPNKQYKYCFVTADTVNDNSKYILK